MNPYSNNTVAVTNNDLDWPQRPSGILIMGKRQGTKPQNKQLWGRVALGAALWYSAPRPKPYLLFVAADIHGPNHASDAERVKSWLIQEFGIPADYLIVRQKTNCTLLELRAVRVLSRAYGLAKIFAVTHLYHAPRTQRYANEVLADAVVIPVHLDILNEITFPMEAEDLFKKVQHIIKDSLPGPVDSTREHLIEWFLNHAHTLDPRGRFERLMAKALRPGLAK